MAVIPGGSPLKPFARLRRFGSDECLEDLGSGRLKVSYSTMSGGLESLEAGSDECLEDLGSGKLKVTYSTKSRGSRRSCGGWK